MNKHLQKIEELLVQLLPADVDERLLEAVEYALSSGGKRIRPAVLVDTAEVMGGCDDNIYKLAVALELIHNYSLVHDDLPCMDNDDFRRGKPSVHKQYDECTAVLVGDFLLNSAVEIATTCIGENSFKCINYLMRCGRKMISGQSADTLGKCETVIEYAAIAYDKTGALLSASIVIPAIYHGFDDIGMLEEIALNLGLIYQLADDLAEEDGEQCNITNIVSRDESIGLLKSVSAETTFLIEQYEADYNVDLAHLKLLATLNIS